jgi:hypothetical protein
MNAEYFELGNLDLSLSVIRVYELESWTWRDVGTILGISIDPLIFAKCRLPGRPPVCTDHPEGVPLNIRSERIGSLLIILAAAIRRPGLLDYDSVSATETVGRTNNNDPGEASKLKPTGGPADFSRLPSGENCRLAVEPLTMKH